MKMRLCKWCRNKVKGWDDSNMGGWYGISGCEWCDCGMKVAEMELTEGDLLRLNGSPEGTMRVGETCINRT